MVNMIDQSEAIKSLLTQYCDQNFKFSANMKILGSVHVLVDNTEVVTCLLDEKFYSKSPQQQQQAVQNAANGLYNHHLHPNQALQLVTTLSQFHQQQQQQQQQLAQKIANTTAPQIITNKAFINSSGSSTKSLPSSSSSASSSSSYSESCASSSSSCSSSSSNKHKRKRFTPKSNSISDEAALDKDENEIDHEHDEAHNHQVNLNEADEDHDELVDDEAAGDGMLHSGVDSDTPFKKRNRRENSAENVDADTAAAAATLSLISAAAAASKFLNQTNKQAINHSLGSVYQTQQQPQVLKAEYYNNGEESMKNLQQQQQQMLNSNENDENKPLNLLQIQTVGSVVAAANNTAQQLNALVESNKIKKPKSKYIIEQLANNEQQLKQQILMKSIEFQQQQQQKALQQQQHQQQQHEQIDSTCNSNNSNDTSSDDNQLYMDEDNVQSAIDDVVEGHAAGSSCTASSSASNEQQQQQQNLIMAAAAAAIMNNANNAANNSNGDKLFMPNQLALNLAVAKQQQHQLQLQLQQLQQQQQQQTQPNQNLAVPIKKKKQKQQEAAAAAAAMMAMMSPSSSASSTSSSASISNILNNMNSGPKSASSISSSSSSTTSTSSTKSKKSRQTIAALAAAAAAATSALSPSQIPTATSIPNAVTVNTNTSTATPATNLDLQRNLVALATQFGLANKTDPTPNGQVQPPNSTLDAIIHEMNNEKAKLLATHTPKPAISKHLKKQHLLSASLNNTPVGNSNPVSVVAPSTGQKEKKNYTKKNKIPTGEVNVVQNGENVNGAPQTAVTAMAAALHYQLYGSNPVVNGQTNQTGMTPQKPFQLINAPNVANTPGGSKYDMEEEEQEPNGAAGAPPGALMNSNLEFECTACEKKFKYYCYYKRHMDACHSEWPKYVCNTCNKSYKWEASFRQHLRSHHNAPVALQQLNGMMNRAGAGTGEMIPPGEEEDEDEEEECEETEMKNQMNGEALCIEPVTTTIVTTNEDEDEEEEEMESESEKELDSQEQDIEQQICQSQNEAKQSAVARESDAASTLASIADSINAAIMNHQ